MSIVRERERERESNIELLRIIAMFLVLVVHSCYFSLGTPSQHEIIVAPVPTGTRIFFQSVSVACVDIFVLISGWFGIRPKAKSFANFIFQCLFFLIGLYTFLIIFGFAEISYSGIASCFLLLNWNWFIKAYLLLYLVSPILNAFIEKVSERQLKNFIILFYIIHTIYGWIWYKSTTYIEGGSSIISFIGLYLLARYCNLYKPNFTKLKKSLDCLIIVTLQISMFIGEFLMLRYLGRNDYMLGNASPFVIMLSLFTVILFHKIRFKSRLINFIARSSFAVFLFHTNYHLCHDYFIPTIQEIYNTYNGISVITIIFLFLIVIYIISIIIDQVRIALFNKYILPCISK